MSMRRRVFLRGTLAGGAVGVAVGAGLLTPRAVLAVWPQSAFESKSIDDALKGLYDSQDAADSADISIKAPDIAENGAVVPVSVETTLPNVASISIIAEQNARPLTAEFKLSPETEGFVSTRIKMGKTSKVIAVVESDGKLYRTQKEVKVTIGGCGG